VAYHNASLQAPSHSHIQHDINTSFLPHSRIYCSLTKTAAIPYSSVTLLFKKGKGDMDIKKKRRERTRRLTIPEPIHILVTKIFFFSLLASDRAVATCLAPVHPSGWPKAIAPPTGFTYSSALAVNGMEKGGRTFS
jgi:hypothetical protein